MDINPVLPIAAQNFPRYLEKHLEFFMFFSRNPIWETLFNPLPPNDIYIHIVTVPLTSRRCILNIYSKNIRTEYFKHAA
jgi:hypothetical protein